MFDTITGLPLHPLVIHGVVVGVPLMAVLTSWWRSGRTSASGSAWWVAGANFLLFLLTLVAKQSGEALQQAKGGQIAIEHGQLGSILPWFVLVLTRARPRWPGRAATVRSGRSPSWSRSSPPSRRCTGRSGPETRARARCGGDGTLTG